jgi:hypothetical protein
MSYPVKSAGSILAHLTQITSPWSWFASPSCLAIMGRRTRYAGAEAWHLLLSLAWIRRGVMSVRLAGPPTEVRRAPGASIAADQIPDSLRPDGLR